MPLKRLHENNHNRPHGLIPERMMMMRRGAEETKVNKLRHRYGLIVDWFLSYTLPVFQLQRLILSSGMGRLQTVLLKIYKDSVIVCF
jgi:hypothetical protein